MEDRIRPASEDARGGALIALAVVLAITVGWWALALWPAGAVEPEWLARTRAACFGAVHGGLPDAGGWILLVGEPLGMLMMIALVFGRSLGRDLRWLRSHRVARLVCLTLGSIAVAAPLLLVIRATGVWAAATARPSASFTAPRRVDRPAPEVVLVDQDGRAVNLARPDGRPTLLTFAFGHCATVCPAIVAQLRTARREAGMRQLPIVIVTLDPWRDTPDRLPTLAEHWALGKGDRVLSGEIADVNRALDELGVGRRRNDTNGDIDHAATVMMLDGGGRVAWRVDGGLREVEALLRQFGSWL